MIQGCEKVMLRLLFNQRAKNGSEENIVYRLLDKNGFKISLTQCLVNILSMNSLIIARQSWLYSKLFKPISYIFYICPFSLFKELKHYGKYLRFLSTLRKQT